MQTQNLTDDEGRPPSAIAELKIEDEAAPLSARYSLRFVEHPGRPATPVLYYDGRRVIRAWSLELKHAQPADRWGISGGWD